MAFHWRNYLIVSLCALVCTLPAPSNAGFFDYFPNRAEFYSYFMPQRFATDGRNHAADTLPTVPYELAATDEQFLRDAAKQLGSLGPVGELDMCQQRVVLTLQRSCTEMNAEALGKLAVALLNCQSDAEGRRPLYGCTDAMSLEQCTLSMDADAWNAYHAMTNRAQAVCTTVRQSQFRGLAELTVNRLAEAAKEQVQVMTKLSAEQQRLHADAQQSLQALGAKGGDLLAQQQSMAEVATEHRRAVEASMQALLHEKQRILAGQQEVAGMIATLQSKLDAGLGTLDDQTERTRQRHTELLHDLETLQKAAAEISQRLHSAIASAASQSDAAAAQFEQTVDRLSDIRGTVFEVAQRMHDVQQFLDAHVAWMAERVGGGSTVDVVQKVQLAMQYGLYTLAGMLVLVFLNAGPFGRVIFVLATCAAFGAEYAKGQRVRFVELTGAIAAIIFVNFLRRFVHLLLAFKRQPPQAKTAHVNGDIANNNNQTSEKSRTQSVARNAVTIEDANEEDDEDDDYYAVHSSTGHRPTNPSLVHRLMTPSMPRDVNFERHSLSRSRSGTPYSTAGESRTRCNAITLRGDRCRKAAQLDSERCALHARALQH